AGGGPADQGRGPGREIAAEDVEHRVLVVGGEVGSGRGEGDVAAVARDRGLAGGGVGEGAVVPGGARGGFDRAGREVAAQALRVGAAGGVADVGEVAAAAAQRRGGGGAAGAGAEQGVVARREGGGREAEGGEQQRREGGQGHGKAGS